MAVDKKDSTSNQENSPLQIEPVLALDNKIPLDVDSSNLEEQARRVNQEILHNQSVLLDHTFPWHYVILYPLTLLVLWAGGRMIPRLFAKVIKPKPPVSPREAASQELKQLKILSEGSFDAFYVQLTQILRKFIEQQYKMPVNEMTTEEFMQHMTKEAPFNLATRQMLSELLAYADQVKFAKGSVNDQQCIKAREYAQAFINKV